MEHIDNKDCCKGCLNGTPGGNPKCQAKLMVEKINANRKNKTL